MRRQLPSLLHIAYSRCSLGTSVSDACDLMEGHDVIEEFQQLFEIKAVYTLAQRPQANALAERNGA